MQIVINISDNVYKRALVYKDIQLASNSANDLSELITAVANGTPLPKGHGRLIDSDLLNKRLNFIRCNRSVGYQSEQTSIGIGIAINENLDAPTIIKADKVANDRKDCPYRHEENGNCLPVGGFCLAVTDDHCKYLKEVENGD